MHCKNYYTLKLLQDNSPDRCYASFH